MSIETKSDSPFNPGGPVSAEFFVGRQEQLKRIEQRGIGQVAQGKPMAYFIEGEYGIGKSSVAKLCLEIAEKDFGLLPAYAPLYGAKTLDEVIGNLAEAVVKASVANRKRLEKVRHWVARYIREVTVLGVSLDLDAVRRDAPKHPASVLEFLSTVYNTLKEEGIRGIFIVLDEINGISAEPQFTRFLKSLWDDNAVWRKTVPILMMVCGTDERWRELLRSHEPVGRIFDLISIEPVTPGETREFFTRAFDSVNISIHPNALDIMVNYSGGLPRIMHVIGDETYWTDTDNVISEVDAVDGIVRAAEVFGRKYVDPQVFGALRSEDYLSILSKIVEIPGAELGFRRADVEKKLSAAERAKFGNFVRRMKQLNVLRDGELRGKYEFNVRMVPVYVQLQRFRKELTDQPD